MSARIGPCLVCGGVADFAYVRVWEKVDGVIYVCVEHRPSQAEMFRDVFYVGEGRKTGRVVPLEAAQRRRTK